MVPLGRDGDSHAPLPVLIIRVASAPRASGIYRAIAPGYSRARSAPTKLRERTSPGLRRIFPAREGGRRL